MASVDVAIPSYNYGRYLRACVESVLSQTGVELRVLIIDNASTDDSPQIARDLADRDRRIELLLRDENLGPHSSFNFGVDWAQADYFAILCADDLLAPGALAQAANVMEKNADVNLVYGRTEFVPQDFSLGMDFQPQPDNYRVIEGRQFLTMFCSTGRSPIRGPTTVVRTRVQKRAGYYLPTLAHTDDVEMWMRFGCFGSVAELDAIQLFARLHPSNQSASVTNVHAWNVEMEHAFAAFFGGTGASLDQALRLHRMARHSLADRAYWCAISHLLRGDTGVRELFRFALRLRPTLALLPPLGSLFHRAEAIDRIRETLLASFATRRLRTSESMARKDL